MGDINRIEYCASNSYLDYLTADKVRFKNTKVISVNWPAWSDIGMVRGQIVSGEDSLRPLKGIERLMHLNAIDHNDGAEIFYRLINQSAHGQVAVSKLNLRELKAELFKPAAPVPSNNEIKILESDYTGDQYKAAQIFCGVLGLEAISIHDDFFRIGGNSILAIQVSHRMSKAFRCDIKVGELFKFKTIKALTDNAVQEVVEVKKTKFVF
jgi:hypothetical protein